MYLLDTNVVSELRRPDRADKTVLSWASQATEDNFFLSVVTIFELEYGALLVGRRDPTRGAMLGRWLDNNVIPRFADRILPMDIDVARRAASLHIPNRRPERDGLLAATALVHAMTIVTRNTVDFDGTGVRLLNPWTEAAS